MKTTFPDHDRNRYIMVDADAYEELYTAQQATAHLLPSSNNPEEEKAIENLGVTIGLAVMEVFMGRRPLHHLSPWLSTACYRSISNQVKATHHLLDTTFSPASANSPRNAPAQRITPRRIVLQKVSPKAYEICLIVQDSNRARALALRAEKSSHRWRICTITIA